MEDIQKLLHIFCGGEFCNFSLVPVQRMTDKIKVDPACSPQLEAYPNFWNLKTTEE